MSDDPPLAASGPSSGLIPKGRLLELPAARVKPTELPTALKRDVTGDIGWARMSGDAALELPETTELVTLMAPGNVPTLATPPPSALGWGAVWPAELAVTVLFSRVMVAAWLMVTL